MQNNRMTRKETPGKPKARAIPHRRKPTENVENEARLNVKTSAEISKQQIGNIIENAAAANCLNGGEKKVKAPSSNPA